MNILLFGKGGQVGWELQRSLAPLGELTALDFDSTDLRPTFQQPRGLAATVRALRPDVIVNAAAHTAVDKAESEPDWPAPSTPPRPACWPARPRAWAPGWCTTAPTTCLTAAAPPLGGRPTAPLSVYGRTKLEGEQLIRASRLPAPDPAHQLGLRRARRQLRQDHAALAPSATASPSSTTSIGAPTGADLLADVTAHCHPRTAAPNRLAGTYHAWLPARPPGTGYASLRDRTPAPRAAGQGGARIDRAGAHQRLSHAGQRPHNSRLDTSQAAATFGLTLPHWQPASSACSPKS
jgi:dTDP-4-dehydrorhamnose reductase